MIVPRTKFLRVAEDYVGDRERLPLGSMQDPLRQNLLRLLASCWFRPRLAVHVTWPDRTLASATLSVEDLLYKYGIPYISQRFHARDGFASAWMSVRSLLKLVKEKSS